jgi:hypothetical protein
MDMSIGQVAARRFEKYQWWIAKNAVQTFEFSF